MTATNFNKAVCDELLNNSREDDMYRISHGWYPMGDWKVTKHVEDFTSIERTQEIGNYAVMSTINVFCGKRMELSTHVYLHNREKGSEIEYYSHETNEIDDKLSLHIKMFISSVMKDCGMEE